MLKENVEKVLKEIENGNDRGEKITLVAATKMNDAKTINEAISYGVSVVAENKVQEFREKEPFLMPCRRHFIGHLQTNKVKYIVGKVELIQSVDTFRLAEEIDGFSDKHGYVQDILAEINAGNEDSKSGFNIDDAFDVALKLTQYKNIRIRGLMAMMPHTENSELLVSLFNKMRDVYDKLKKEIPNFDYLSMGMSEDYALAIKNGSNMIRLGTALFGKRNYGGNI